MQRVAAASFHLSPDGQALPRPKAAGGTPVWPYTQDERVPWRTRLAWLVDPINLLFAGTDTARIVRELERVGWRRPRIGATHRTWIGGRPAAMTDHTALGPHEERFHVRLWDVAPGCVLGAAHREVAGRLTEHVVTSWDAARAKVVADLCSLGWERLAPGGLIAMPAVRGVPGDGRAWRVAAPLALSGSRDEEGCASARAGAAGE